MSYTNIIDRREIDTRFEQDLALSFFDDLGVEERPPDAFTVN